LIVDETNLYARRKQEEKDDLNWRDVTEREIKAWMGMSFYEYSSAPGDSYVLVNRCPIWKPECEKNHEER